MNRKIKRLVNNVRNICDDEYREIECPKNINTCCHFCKWETKCEKRLGFKPCQLSIKECLSYIKEDGE